MEATPWANYAFGDREAVGGNGDVWEDLRYCQKSYEKIPLTLTLSHKGRRDIEGAVHFPWAKVIGDPGLLPKDKLLVLYCGCIGEEASDNVAQQLMNPWGYTNIKVLDGGLMRWVKLGYPVEMDCL